MQSSEKEYEEILKKLKIWNYKKNRKYCYLVYIDTINQFTLISDQYFFLFHSLEIIWFLGQWRGSTCMQKYTYIHIPKQHTSNVTSRFSYAFIHKYMGKQRIHHISLSYSLFIVEPFIKHCPYFHPSFICITYHSYCIQQLSVPYSIQTSHNSSPFTFSHRLAEEQK